MELQRTDAWLSARCGCVTASNLGRVMAKTKSEHVSATRKNYMMELLCQRLTGKNDTSFTSTAMQRGIDLEPLARKTYILNQFDAKVTEVGFIPHPTIHFFGASPDGLVNDDGLLEIKCPNTSTHLDTLITREPKHEYLLQMHAQMLCTGRRWCDFVSFDNRLPDNLAYFVTRIHQNNALAVEIEKEVTLFLLELETKLVEINELHKLINH